MDRRTVGLIGTTFLLCGAALGATQRNHTPPPSSPAIEAPPAWSRVVPMPDGRTFVTDGGLAVDAAIAKPSALPSNILSPENGAVFARLLTGPFDEEISLSELRPGAVKNTFTAPNGVALNGNYVNFLRRVAGRAQLRVKGELDPIVIVLNGQPIGVLMGVRR